MVRWEYLMMSDMGRNSGFKFVHHPDSRSLYFSHRNRYEEDPYKNRRSDNYGSLETNIWDFLRRLGDDGWEMCGAFRLEHEGMGEDRYFFKRPIAPRD